MVAYEIFDFLHFLGLAFGLGGATIATIISAKADKDKQVASVIMKIMPPISKLIFSGLILLIISGIAMPFFMAWPVNKQLLIVKHVLVVWIFIIGIFIGTRMKKMKRLTLVGKDKPSQQFFRVKKQMKTLSIINLILWYAVTLMSAFV